MRWIYTTLSRLEPPATTRVRARARMRLQIRPDIIILSRLGPWDRFRSHGRRKYIYGRSGMMDPAVLLGMHRVGNKANTEWCKVNCHGSRAMPWTTQTYRMVTEHRVLNPISLRMGTVSRPKLHTSPVFGPAKLCKIPLGGQRDWPRAILCTSQQTSTRWQKQGREEIVFRTQRVGLTAWNA